jgi:hypothetical protein
MYVFTCIHIYTYIDDTGLHITKKAKDGTKTSQVLDVDSVIICAGQEPLKELEAALTKATHSQKSPLYGNSRCKYTLQMCIIKVPGH